MALSRLWRALSRTSDTLAGSHDHTANTTQARRLTPVQEPKDWEELEERFITADMGPRLARHLVDELRHSGRSMASATDAAITLLRPWLDDVEKPFQLDPASLNIVLVIGVNGSGKTSACGKLASRLAAEGKKVGLVAADTFRAAAIDQIRHWASAVKCPCYAAEQGTDPAAIVFRSLDEAQVDNLDVLLIDTAGRLHNKQHLLDELTKIKRVIQKKISNQPLHTLVVMDAASGQNALKQVEAFLEHLGVNGLIITKIDGSTRGGIVVAVAERTSLPIYFLSLGEGIDDLVPFKADSYLGALFGSGAAMAAESGKVIPSTER